MEYVCKTNAANYRDRLLPDIFRLSAEDLGVTGSQGEYNRQHAKSAKKPFINNNFLKTFSVVVESASRTCAESWETAGGAETAPGRHGRGPPLSISSSTSSPPSLSTTNSNLLEKSREVITGAEAKFEENPMLEAYHRSAEIMGQVFITPLPLLKLGAKFGVGRLRELIEAYEDLERMGDDIVKQRREMHQGTIDAGREIEQVCLLDTMLFLEDENGNRAYTDEELWGDMNDIMAAGHQARAATMTMALLYVSRNPDVKAKIEAEVRALGGAPTFEDVSEGRLSYTQSVIKETLRLHPPIHMFPRLASEADVMPTGHKVRGPAISSCSARGPWDATPTCGRTHGVRPRAVHGRAPGDARAAAGPGANEEEIERAVTMLRAGRDFIYTPFGAGPRSCIGGLFSFSPSPPSSPASCRSSTSPRTTPPYPRTPTSRSGTTSPCATRTEST